MKAIVYRRYGPPEVLHIEDVEKPIPGEGEILIRVRATTVSAGDVRMRKADPFAARLYNGLFRPKRVNILGFELAGDVEGVGANVTRFVVGDAVFVFTGFRFGAYAEYICLPENGTAKRGLVAPKPTNLNYEEAAVVPVGGTTALRFLRQAKVQRGSRVLIYGASGSVGAYAVQLAHHFGAEVTAVCSTANLDLLRSLGANRVIDYTQEDFAAHGETWDVVFDAVGRCPKADMKRATRKGGVALSVMGSPDGPTLDDLLCLKQLLEAGSVRPVIDRTYMLEEVPEAHRYVEMGHKRGNVVVTVGEGEP